MAKQDRTRKSGWKQWTADEARAALKAWRASGLSMSAYAVQTGVTSQRLTWWMRRLGEWAAEAQSSSELRLVPVIAAAQPTKLAAARARWTATMHLPGGVTLEFDVAEVPAAWVAEVALEVARAR